MKFILKQIKTESKPPPFRAEMRANLVQVVRFTLKIVILVFLLPSLGYLSLPLEKLLPVLSSTFALIIILIMVIVVSHIQWWQKRIEFVCLLVIAIVMTLLVYRSFILEDTFMVPFAAAITCAISAAMLPWLIRYQIATVIISSLAIMVSFISLQDTTTQTLERSALAGLSVSLISIFLAWQSNEHRFELWQTKMMLHSSEGKHRQFYEELKDVEARYHSILNSTPDAIIIYDIHGRTEYINDSFTRMFGWTLFEIREHSPFVFEAERDATVMNVVRVVHDGIPISRYETKRLTKSGDILDVSISASRFDDHEGQPAGMVAITHDITKRKKAESEREQLISDLDAYAHTVAHDLKSPLGGVLASTMILMEDFSQSIPESGAIFLKNIERSSNKMNDIIDALLLLSSIRAMDELEKETLDMKHIIAEAMTHLSTMIEEYKAEIIVEESEQWLDTLGYAPWIEEVWTNYISNAIKYGGKPPRVQLGADSEPRDGKVRFWAKDNGPGISANNQAKVFELFSRLDATSAEGHGIGLSIVQRIVEKLGGEVGVESESGAGSSFYFTLPRAE
jgi:PAS domain S-box-containing protein